MGSPAEDLTALLSVPNPNVIDRQQPKIYIGDVFNLRMGAQYITRNGKTLSLTSDRSKAARFKLDHKYSGCPRNGLEYDSNDLNNRNINCTFPYEDCVRRCGKRKLLLDVDGKWSILGTKKSCAYDDGGPQCPVVWEILGDWKTYELNVR